MLTNKQIVQLVNTGVLQTTSHTVPPKDAYKLLKFKRAVKDAMERIEKAEKDFPKEVGISDTAEFDKRFAYLQSLEEPTEEEKAELKEKEELLSRLNEIREAFFSEKCPLKDVKTMDYESYRALALENKDLEVTQFINGKFNTRKFDVFSINEDILEDILWVAPVD